MVIWGILSADLVRKDKVRGRLPIVAYEKDAPTKGGSVALADGNVYKVTADEFKSLKLASPGK